MASEVPVEVKDEVGSGGQRGEQRHLEAHPDRGLQSAHLWFIQRSAGRTLWLVESGGRGQESGRR